MSNNKEIKYKISYGIQFLKEYPHYPPDQQNAIALFLKVFTKYGLKDFSKFEGKVSPSWKNVDESSPVYKFTKGNKLWHYHVGIPYYKKSNYYDYKTSDYILHFMLLDNQKEIVVIDITPHYDSYRNFWLPKPNYLIY